MSADDPKPKIVLFSGGTACRAINISLAERGYRLARIVPAWDSGGSSKELRERFGMLPIGDVRQALMTMAHGEGHASDVVKIFNARLSDSGTAEELNAEFEWFASGRHPLIKGMESALGKAILNYLVLFRANAPDDFDLRNGSIGNFVLTGAYLAHDRNINRAIAVFRKLCAIEGHVWPASVDDGVQEQALLGNGKKLARQHLITKMDADDSAAGIAQISISTGSGGDVAANARALAEIADADMIVFGPGSFYTSIFPHVLVDGVVEAVSANQHAARIFVGNILECVETSGATLGGLLDVFSSKLPSLTHVLANRELFPFEKKVGKFPYLRPGALQDVCDRIGAVNLTGDFEDAWTRGQHDGERVADSLAGILAGRG